MKLSQLLRSTKPGTSLLIGLGITTIIVLVSIGVTTVVISSIRESANVTGANQAYYAAEGALEKGLLVNLDKGAGFSADTTAVFTTPPKATYTIGGQVPDDADLKYPDGYGIPAPGTGNAGTGCDPLKPTVKTDFWYDNATQKFFSSDPSLSTAEKFGPKDHPCNWGKLKVGETVTIPLYYTDPVTGNAVPVFTGTSWTFALKLRTACTNGQAICTIRPDLDTTKGDTNYNKDDPIVSWQITGQSPDGSKTYILSPYLKFDTLLIPPQWNTATSIAYESKINANKSTGFQLLTQASGGVDSKGCRGSILKFLTNQDTSSGCPSTAMPPNWSLQYITKPVLKLSVIHSLDEFAGEKIPFIEYQILTDASLAAPPTDTTQTIKAEGYSGTFKQVLEVKNPQETGLLEYVIQQ